MALFINLRASSRGGIVAAEATAWDDGSFVDPTRFANRVAGRNLLLATHGFNVDQESGIEALSLWSRSCTLPYPWLFVAVLWAGDSKYLPVVDYVYEGVEAIDSGKLLAAYLNANASRAQSLTFASHSLGARMVLETVRHLDARPRNVVLMAPAIEDDALAREYADSARRVSRTTFVLASRADAVLKLAFPIGNLLGQIVMHGHPYNRTALGREGPARPLPPDVDVASWQIPDGWDYGHLDYLPRGSIGSPIAVPNAQPDPQAPVPVAEQAPGVEPWKPSWSAGAVAAEIA